jgi:hypothetical protein
MHYLLIDLMLRSAERTTFKPTESDSGDPLADLRDGGQFQAQPLFLSHMPDLVQATGDPAVQQPSETPPEKPEPSGVEAPDDKITRFVPRQRPEPERMPGDDDDDPGPAAA